VIKQLILPLVGVALFVVLVGTFVKNPSKLGIKTSTTVSPDASSQEIVINNVKIAATIANSPEERSRGLSGTQSLTENSGMLFVFEAKDASPIFWMKDMLIPIDIVWINDGKIVQIDEYIEPPIKGAPDSELKLFKPQGKVDYVLELPAGFCDKNNIKIGDETKFDL